MKIKELYTDESKWTHGANARDTNGAPVLTHSQRACKWCLLGAIMYCYEDTGEYDKITDFVYTALPEYEFNITGWNDDSARTFAEVKELVEHLDI